MNKERKAQIITAGVLVVALGVVVARKARPNAPSEPAGPQDAIYAMLDAAREGNVRRFMSSYSGEMAQSLGQTLREGGEPQFAKYLRESNVAVKGVAINEPQPLSEREVKARVEYVYQDRNEVQYMYLEKTGAGWKIHRVDSSDRVKTLVPYGTPVQ